MNKHDQRRLVSLARTLDKAHEQATNARLYLAVNEADLPYLARVALAIEHIKIAMEHLCGRSCRVCGCTEHDACPDGCYWVEDDLCSSCRDDEHLQLGEGAI